MAVPGGDALTLTADQILQAVRGRPDVAWVEDFWRYHQGRFADDLCILDRFAPHGRIADIGSAPFFFAGVVRRTSRDVVAVDGHPERFTDLINELALDVRACDIELEPLPFADDEVDVVVFNELFEHLRINPIFTMSEVHRVLAPDGVLLLSTPNLRSLVGVLRLIVKGQAWAASAAPFEQYTKLSTIGHMGHVREYTAREMTDFLEHCGFSVSHVVFRGSSRRQPVAAIERMAPPLRPYFTLVGRPA